MGFAEISTGARRHAVAVLGEVIPARRITPAVVDEMWALWKREFLLLGDEGQRRQHFDDTCRDLTTVGLARNRDGDLVGFWSANTCVRTWQGVRFSQVYVPHYVISRDSRGSVAPYLTATRSFLLAFARHLGRPLYVVAGTFPGSYIAIRSGPTTLITLDDADPWEASLLRDVAATMGKSDWDPASGLIHGHQIPRDASRDFHPHGAHATALKDYLRLNPTWREGTVLPVLVRVGLNPLTWAREISRRRGHADHSR